MLYLFPILTIAGGLLAASSLIIARQPRAKDIFAKIAPYQTVFGAVLFGVGIWWAIRSLPQLGALFSASPFAATVTVGAIAANLMIGLAFGFDILSRIALAKNDAARAKGARAQARIRNVQIPVGLVAIVSGALSLM